MSGEIEGLRDALARAEKERDEARLKLDEIERELGEPDWCCADCGSRDHRGIVYPSTPNGPQEYDMECNVCNSLNIAESCAEAASTLGDKLDTARAERDEARAEVERLRQCVHNALRRLGPASPHTPENVVGAEALLIMGYLGWDGGDERCE